MNSTIKVKEPVYILLIFSVGFGFIFLMWLFGRFEVIGVEGMDNPLFTTFCLVFILPVFLYITYRLFRRKNRIEISESHLLLRSIHLVPKSIDIPLKCIVTAEVFDFDTGDGLATGLRIKLREQERISFSGGDSLFDIKDGNFECMLWESHSKAHILANLIKQKAQPG